MGLFGFIKDIISSTQSEKVAKAASSTNGGVTKRYAPRRGITINDFPKPDTANHRNSSPSSAQQKKVETTNRLLRGWKEYDKGEELWDKGHKAEAAKCYEQAIAEGYGNDYRHFVHLGVYYTERKD